MNISQYFSLIGAVVLERLVKIPQPVLKENETEYLEDLTKISEDEKDFVQNNSNQDEIRIIRNENSEIGFPEIDFGSYWSKFFISSITGFSIPFFIWIFLYLSLGEPCVIFSCRGTKWIFWDYFYANLYFGIVILIVSLLMSFSSKTIFPMLFFFGFCIGSFLGMSVGEWLVIGSS